MLQNDVFISPISWINQYFPDGQVNLDTCSIIWQIVRIFQSYNDLILKDMLWPKINTYLNKWFTHWQSLHWSKDLKDLLACLWKGLQNFAPCFEWTRVQSRVIKLWAWACHNQNHNLVAPCLIHDKFNYIHFLHDF